jgi:hypothetical protein
MRVPSRIGVILAFTVLTVVAAPMPRAIGRPSPKPGDSQAPNHFECTPNQLPTCGRSGDQGDAPMPIRVMPGDFSDLDAIRVGGDYYAISDAAVCPGSDHSTFHGSGELEDHRSRGRGSDCHRSQTQLRDIWTWTHSNIPSSLDGVIDSTPARRTRLLR